MGAVIVMDFDDVLVSLAPKMYSAIRKNWRIFNKWFVDLGPLSDKEVQDREFFKISEWLIKKEFINESSRDYLLTQEQISYELNKVFFSTNVYWDSEPTEFAKRTLLNPMYINSGNVSKVYILSRNISDEQEASKKEFIKKYFNHPKIEYINVNSDESKGKILNNLKINWNLLVDDELENIEEIAKEAESLKGKEFLCPKYGYNKMYTRLDLLIKGKSGIFTYYDPFKK